MRTITFFLFIAAMLLIAGCKPKVETSKDMALADSLLTVNENAYNSGDAQVIADMFTDDALTIGNGKSTWSKDSILVYAKSIVPIIKNFKAYLGCSSVSADMVYMEKYWTVDAVVEGNTMKVRGLSTLIWIKQPDNSWKIVMEKTDDSIKPY